ATSRLASLPPLHAAPARSENGVKTASDQNNLRRKAVPAIRATVACRKDMSGSIGTNICGRVRLSILADDILNLLIRVGRGVWARRRNRASKARRLHYVVSIMSSLLCRRFHGSLDGVRGDLTSGPTMTELNV